MKRLFVISLVVMFVISGLAATKASKVYDDAIDEMANGNYAYAAKLFESIGSFEDASTLAMYCKANAMAEAGEYIDAINAFNSFGDYKDCKYLSLYYSARKLEDEASNDISKYAEAAELYNSIKLFKDSASRVNDCRIKLYTYSDALIINDHVYSPAEVSYFYAAEYQNFVRAYGNYISIFGLDTSKGISGIAHQECSMIENGTWKDYFLDAAIIAIKQNQALVNYAIENGIELTNDEKQQVDDSIAEIKKIAPMYGYKNGDEFIAANYGFGNNLESVKEYALKYAIASKVYTIVAEKIAESVTSEEIEKQYPASEENPESNDSARENIANKKMNSWLEELTINLSVEKTEFFELAGDMV